MAFFETLFNNELDGLAEGLYAKLELGVQAAIDAACVVCWADGRLEDQEVESAARALSAFADYEVGALEQVVRRGMEHVVEDREGVLARLSEKIAGAQIDPSAPLLVALVVSMQANRLAGRASELGPRERDAAREVARALGVAADLEAIEADAARRVGQRANP